MINIFSSPQLIFLDSSFVTSVWHISTLAFGARLKQDQPFHITVLM
jgi:hypothetical protein